jgi:NADPH:quinone reductase
VKREPAGFSRDLSALVHWYAEGLVKPVIDKRLPMHELHQAYARMSGREVRGKVLLLNDL